MTAAMIDRLTHKAYIINMNGNSFRLKETQKVDKWAIIFLLEWYTFQLLFGYFFT
jgi:hypothetical protein